MAGCFSRWNEITRWLPWTLETRLVQKRVEVFSEQIVIVREATHKAYGPPGRRTTVASREVPISSTR